MRYILLYVGGMVNAQPLRISALVGSLLKKAPQDLAEAWDNVGFLAGDADLQTTGVVVSVNLGKESLAAAEASGANLIVCHHPPLFKPIQKLTKASAPFLYEAMRRGIGVLALHTNFDLASQDMNGHLAQRLGSSTEDFLAPRGGSERPASNSLGKFITYVPEDHLDKVRQALAKVGAGRIGDYTECSFSWSGEGTFLGGHSSKPTVGQTGRLEKASERRLEMVFPWKALDKVVSAARAAHPYDEMAYDIIKLEQTLKPVGYGFVGSLKEKRTFSQLLRDVKEVFELQSVTVVGPGLETPEASIKKIAFSPGSGSSFVNAAVAKGVDAYICGEVGYHQMLDAKRAGLSLIILGHSYSERFFVETAAEWCEELVPGRVQKIFEVVHQSV